MIDTVEITTNGNVEMILRTSMPKDASVIRSDSMIKLKQKVIEVRGSNPLNEHRYNSTDGLLQCTYTTTSIDGF